MRIDSAKELGHRVRERRRDLHRSQVELAALAGVSRRWLVDLESGKPTAEVGLVLRTLAALDLIVDLQASAQPPNTVDPDELPSPDGDADEQR